MKRYLILLSAVGMQLCLGATYSWSVYVAPLKQVTGLQQGPVQLPFSVFYFAFPATMFFSGSLLPRIGPRRAALLGGVLFGGGWLLASLGKLHFVFTVAGIGLLAGVGAGFAYIVPIATCIQWFPKYKGLVTGVAVAGFGGGAALVSQFAGYWMHSRGATPFETFGMLGLIFLILISGAALSMAAPPEAHRRFVQPLKLGEAWSKKTFRVLYLAMLAGLAAGFTVNANLKELSSGQTVQTGITAVALFAVANAVGRLSWGLIFDRVRSATAIQANLICQAVLLCSAPVLLGLKSGFLVFAFLAGFNYGGVLVVYASSTARIWGNDRVGQVYAWLFSANIPAALAPMLAGYGYDRLGSFTPPLLSIAALLGAAVLLVRKKGALINESS
ncbi:MAG: MFS transporter [Deltaproteobacteria bacterium]|nr:MFS transporter [Deltaproteobacteria bacterium]